MDGYKPRRARLFIDFWNFQLNWNERMPLESRCDWPWLPTRIVTRVGALLEVAGISGGLELEETLVYASVDPSSDAKLKNWLQNFLEAQPSFRVKLRERRARPKQIHCRHCGSIFDKCGVCEQLYAPRPEKGVDTAIVTDLLSLAWQDGYDVAVLVSSDADFIPAVEHVQAKGLKVINASWSRHGYELRKTCWAAFDLDDITAELVRDTT